MSYSPKRKDGEGGPRKNFKLRARLTAEYTTLGKMLKVYRVMANTSK